MLATPDELVFSGTTVPAVSRSLSAARPLTRPPAALHGSSPPADSKPVLPHGTDRFVIENAMADQHGFRSP
ncbi:hypothetical protein GCM10010440_67830 [Kitasatospora cinereorecta]